MMPLKQAILKLLFTNPKRFVETLVEAISQ